ncbi:hypothetical protein TNCV_2340111 [Trichonephila clavipes]|nr:hypothetical protein TNCV_2340111 [Trichonephila clavipes]
MTQNPIGMKGRKYHSCKVWCKEAEKKNRNSNTLNGRKAFYSKVVLQQMFEIMIRSQLARLIAALHRIPYCQKDSWHVTYPPGS